MEGEMTRRKAATARVDWFYARPGCESCEKARAELDRRGIAVGEERSTREPLGEREAAALLADVDEVWISRGRSVDARPAAHTRVADLKGPTGGIRAPMLRRGGRLLVGFRESTLREWLDKT
jgi:arsenate reductase-like glutaredoxin family protein